MMLRRKELQEKNRRGRRKLLSSINVNSSRSNMDGNFQATAVMMSSLTQRLEKSLGLKNF